MVGIGSEGMEPDTENESTGYVRELIDDITQWLGGLSVKDRDTIRQELPGRLGRLERVVDHVRTKVDLTEYDLVWNALIAEMENRLEPLRESLKGFEQTQDTTALSNIDKQLDGVLERAALWPVIEPSDLGDALTQAAESYRRSLGQRTSSLWQRFDGLESDISSLKGDVQSQRDRLQESTEAATARLNEIGARGEESVAAASAQLEQLKEQIARDRGRLDSAIARYESQFSESQSSRKQEFDTLLERMEESSTSTARSLDESAKEVLEVLRSHAGEAERIVGALATTGVTHEFNREAAEQKKHANYWRWVTIGLGLAAIAIVVWAVLYTPEGGSWAYTAGKVAAGVVTFGVAGYAANQSRDHRRREEAARSLEMDLVAFGPFTKELDPETQSKLREALVEKVFGRSVSSIDATSAPLTQESVTLLDHALDVFIKARKLGG